MADDKEKPVPDWKDVVATFGLRLVDSGLFPWTLVAAFLLVMVWLLTRNLDSKDSLLLLERITSSRSLGVAGWLVAVVEVPIAVWAVRKARKENSAEIKRLEKENVKARGWLKRYKQDELKLET